MVTKAQVSRHLIEWHTSNRKSSPFGGIVDIHKSVKDYGGFNVIDGNGRFHPNARELSKTDRYEPQKASQIAETIKSMGKF